MIQRKNFQLCKFLESQTTVWTDGGVLYGYADGRYTGWRIQS